ncbi:MAG: thiol:disulfide interchange protein DsbA/DsbL [Woeseiaceae bacterium]|jgi:protein dithiol oxidoreductase (disulfide-forming)|nr:thiol:disulfide interchange protein DsbA/DsbL [Woeseiaceae bacterium]
MLLKILLSSMFILSLISCGSEQNSSNKVNSEIKILPSESKRTQFKTSKQTLLIEESDAEESLGNDNQPIILAQASINQNNNWEFTESEHYMRLVPTQPTIGGPDKIEVAEFFYYGCIHCMTFEPIINAWKKDIPESVRFVRVPALWNPLLRLHGRMYYTKEVLVKNGKLKDPEGFRARIFKEYHNRKNYMTSATAIQKIFADFGVTEDDFNKTFESFEVAQKLRLADDLARRYSIASTPSVVVNGKYRTNAGEAGSYPKLIKVINELITRESIR